MFAELKEYENQEPEEFSFAKFFFVIRLLCSCDVNDFTNAPLRTQTLTSDEYVNLTFRRNRVSPDKTKSSENWSISVEVSIEQNNKNRIVVRSRIAENMAQEKQLQDKLILELFDLIEQSVRCKRNIEITTNSGQLLLAKSRYIQGAQSAATSKLPTENSNEFIALKRTNTPDNAPEELQLELVTHKVDKESGFIDPLRWFGVLVPRSLQMAQEHFDKALNYVVECANISLKLNTTISSILLLRNRN